MYMWKKCFRFDWIIHSRFFGWSYVAKYWHQHSRVAQTSSWPGDPFCQAHVGSQQGGLSSDSQDRGQKRRLPVCPSFLSPWLWAVFLCPLYPACMRTSWHCWTSLCLPAPPQTSLCHPALLRMSLHLSLLHLQMCCKSELWRGQQSVSDNVTPPLTLPRPVCWSCMTVQHPLLTLLCT